MLASDMVFVSVTVLLTRHTGSVEKYTEGRKIVHIDLADAKSVACCVRISALSLMLKRR
ncbi:hypothetical protein ACLB1O_16175 [Escherichia coli]